MGYIWQWNPKTKEIYIPASNTVIPDIESYEEAKTYMDKPFFYHDPDIPFA